eukprot:366490-Chlamydomonas_euryale.AAC.49
MHGMQGACCHACNGFCCCMFGQLFAKATPCMACRVLAAMLATSSAAYFWIFFAEASPWHGQRPGNMYEQAVPPNALSLSVLYPPLKRPLLVRPLPSREHPSMSVP